MNTAIIPTIIKLISIFLFTAIAAELGIKLMIGMLHRAGITRENYKSKKVPFAAGIAFLPVLLAASALTLYLFQDSSIIYIGYFFGVSSVGFAGILDDMIGEKDIKGLRNHTVSFLKGHVTTGFIKAFVGFFTALIAVVSISKGILDYIINVFIFALFTNALNLMDLRPGRCIKTFLTIGLIIFLSNLNSLIPIIPLGIVLIIGLVYLAYDLKEQSMLGDTGSNVLGATLGYFSAASFNITVKLVVFLLLLTINMAAEKVSLTKIISKNKILNYLDNLGRSSG
ncbi:MAG: glycosyltransferase [Clostridia bacterium]|jgi:UDP-N-acetylmuramyl pentapeptide phosphotransferase/UDP-N-acetylglucosamine-1-phosphate transferase|nr:glycosyltransferase [Clostridia bacterium]